MPFKQKRIERLDNSQRDHDATMTQLLENSQMDHNAIARLQTGMADLIKMASAGEKLRQKRMW